MARRGSSLTTQGKELMMKTRKFTFGEKVIQLYKNPPYHARQTFPNGIEVLNPYAHTETRECVNRFYEKFFSDNRKRVCIFGINPGRFGGGVTGVPFTDPVALEGTCGIANKLSKRRETSSRFIYEVIDQWGGVRKFYKSFFLTAVFPLGLTRNGLNYNYYDDPSILATLRPLAIESIKKQIGLGMDTESAVVLGTGANHRVFQSINNEYGFFEKVYALEHPRFIMQYQRKNLKRYLRKYQAVLHQAMSS